MFRRKLTALDYHNPAGFNCKGERWFQAGRALSAPTRAPYPDPPRPCLPLGPAGRALLSASSTSAFRRLHPTPGHARASEPSPALLPRTVTFCTC